jgi:hypothetical protein
MSATPTIPSPMPPYNRENPMGIPSIGSVIYRTGKLWQRLEDGLWYEFSMSRDGGSTILAPGQTGYEYKDIPQ